MSSAPSHLPLLRVEKIFALKRGCALQSHRLTSVTSVFVQLRRWAPLHWASADEWGSKSDWASGDHSDGRSRSSMIQF